MKVFLTLKKKKKPLQYTLINLGKSILLHQQACSYLAIVYSVYVRSGTGICIL